jgi:hypothetical protein
MLGSSGTEVKVTLLTVETVHKLKRKNCAAILPCGAVRTAAIARRTPCAEVASLAYCDAASHLPNSTLPVQYFHRLLCYLRQYLAEEQA